MIDPRQGEVWLVEFEPSIGAEISKARPAVIVSVQGIGFLPLRIVVPATDWKEHYVRYSWFTQLIPSKTNGLSKVSGIDAFQCKSVSLDRFGKKLGLVTSEELKGIID